MTKMLYTPIYKTVYENADGSYKKELTKAVIIENGKVVKTISADAYMDLMFGKEFIASNDKGTLKEYEI